MKDFLDVLLEQMQEPQSIRNEAMYLTRLRALTRSAPPLRKIPAPQEASIQSSLCLKTAPVSRIFSTRPDVDLFFYTINDGAEPHWFRAAKELEQTRPFGRLDALQNEAQVLETMAMGADIYCLRVKDHELSTLQYLAEVGEDYGVPVLLRCTDDDELARALFVKAQTWIGLDGGVAVPELLELAVFRDRKLVLFKNDVRERCQLHSLKQLILHDETIEEPRR